MVLKPQEIKTGELVSRHGNFVAMKSENAQSEIATVKSAADVDNLEELKSQHDWDRTEFDSQHKSMQYLRPNFGGHSMQEEEEGEDDMLDEIKDEDDQDEEEEFEEE